MPCCRNGHTKCGPGSNPRSVVLPRTNTSPAEPASMYTSPRRTTSKIAHASNGTTTRMTSPVATFISSLPKSGGWQQDPAHRNDDTISTLGLRWDRGDTVDQHGVTLGRDREDLAVVVAHARDEREHVERQTCIDEVVGECLLQPFGIGLQCLEVRGGDCGE